MLIWTLYAAILLSLLISIYLALSFINIRKNISRRFLDTKTESSSGKVDEAKAMLKKKYVKRSKLVLTVEKMLSEAAVNIEAQRFIKLMCLSIAAIAFIILGLFRSIPIALLAAGGVLFITRWLLRLRKQRRLNTFTQQLPEIINFISGSIKSGYSLMQALHIVAEQQTNMASKEFKKVLQDINLGKTYVEAFDKLVERNPIEEVEILSTAIILTKESGGNISHILDTVSETLVERQKLNGQIKSLTAQGRLSGIILSILPIILFIVFMLINPSFMQPLFTTTLGKVLLGIGIFNQVMGIVLIKKITRIEW